MKNKHLKEHAENIAGAIMLAILGWLIYIIL